MTIFEFIIGYPAHAIVVGCFIIACFGCVLGNKGDQTMIIMNVIFCIFVFTILCQI